MHGREGAIPPMLEAALRGTDQRVAEGKPVTPAFLLAVLLWPAAHAEYQVLVDGGVEPEVAWTRAASRAVREQAARIAMPKRFTIPMQEIWSLQPRFEQTARKKVARLLSQIRP